MKSSSWSMAWAAMSARSGRSREVALRIAMVV